MDNKLNFLLMGKTGVGKSAAGNSILNSRAFKTSHNSSSETKEVSSGYRRFQSFELMVVDGPGLDDTDMNKVEDRITAENHIRKALMLCSTGVHAFLLIIRLGTRFTDENISAVSALKNLFGKNYLNHVIIVITHGDEFQSEANSQSARGKQSTKTFHQWCESQEGYFCQLYDDCQRRCVLLNNNEKDETKKQAEMQELLQLALALKKKYGIYTSSCFVAAERARQKMILELKAPQLNDEIQRKAGLLYADLLALTDSTPDTVNEKIKKDKTDLKNYIKEQDRGFGVLANMIKLLEQMEVNFNSIDELHRLAQQLENARKANHIWGSIGQMFANAEVHLVGKMPVLGVITLFGGCVASERDSCMDSNDQPNGYVAKNEDDSQNELSKHEGYAHLTDEEEFLNKKGTDEMKIGNNYCWKNYSMDSNDQPNGYVAKNEDDSQNELSKHEGYAHLTDEEEFLNKKGTDEMKIGNNYCWKNYRTYGTFLIALATHIFTFAILILAIIVWLKDGNVKEAEIMPMENTQYTFKDTQYTYPEVCIDCKKLVEDPYRNDSPKDFTKREVDGVLKCCAQTSKQMSSLLEAMTTKQVLKAGNEDVYPSAVSAHKVMLSVNEKGENSEQYIPPTHLNFEPEIHGWTEHVQGVTALTDGIVINHSGIYFIYCNVAYYMNSSKNDMKNSTKHLSSSIYRTQPNSAAYSGVLLASFHTVCDHCKTTNESSFTGGSFNLKAGDFLQVLVSEREYVDFDWESTYLGLVMLGKE